MKAWIFPVVFLGVAGALGYLGVTTLLRSQVLESPIRVAAPAAVADRETGENARAANANRHEIHPPATRPTTREVLPESLGYDVLMKLTGPFEDLEEHESKPKGASK